MPLRTLFKITLTAWTALICGLAGITLQFNYQIIEWLLGLHAPWPEFQPLFEVVGIIVAVILFVAVAMSFCFGMLIVLPATAALIATLILTCYRQPAEATTEE
jgi:hypothetical protein